MVVKVVNQNLCALREWSGDNEMGFVDFWGSFGVSCQNKELSSLWELYSYVSCIIVVCTCMLSSPSGEERNN